MPFNCLSFDLINGFAKRVCFLRGARLAVACCGLLTVSTVALAQGDPGDAKAEADMKEYTQKIRNTEISFKMVPIPGGEFLMGSADAESDRNADEGPQHKVKLEPFWMGKTEVTWDEFELWSIRLERALRDFGNSEVGPFEKAADAVTKPTNPYTDMSFQMGKDGGYPAICMTQHAAKTYCEWLTAKTGRYHRLPTEAEWEYACRAGTTTAYHFGDDASALGDFAWHAGNSEENGKAKYHKVGKKKPNLWGLHDMHGNVAEWVQDRFDPEFYGKFKPNEGVKFPLCLADEEYPRVARGGAWDRGAGECRSAARMASDPDWKQQDPQNPKSAWYMTDALWVGFRVVRPLNAPSDDERKNLRLDAVVPKNVKPRVTIE
ncbi:MAG: formylglycine-generating enzyme family protein [Planctomycetota bacterium]|jgi:formylglycine-generating enzyme required for sulfatase activity|nr:MAG: formylglycine-generating enzyme family protein [Planctomycetota bacterium]